MGKQVQIAKSWGRGTQPVNPGTYLVSDESRTNLRMIQATRLGNTVRSFDMDGKPVEENVNLFHYGPLPGIERSIAAVERRAESPVATPAAS